MTVRATPSTDPRPVEDLATRAERDTWGPLPAAAVAEVRLEFYFALGEPQPWAWDPRQPVPEVPEGHRVLLFQRARLCCYVVPEKPDLAMADVGRVDWSPAFQRLYPDGGRSGGPLLVIHFRDAERFRQLAAHHPHDVFVVGVGDQAVAASTNQPPERGRTYARIYPDLGNVGVWFCDLPPDQQTALLPHVKGWPASEGLFIPQGTDPQPFRTLPNTARVTVAAAFSDRALPSGAECLLTPWGNTARPVPYPPAVPTVTGDNGQWAVHNVAPGDWTVTLVGADFVQTSAVIHVAQGETDSHADLRLLHGGTVTGRVVRAGTLQPLPGVSVANFGRDRLGARTDAQGRYVLDHVAPGLVRAEARAPNSDLASVVLDLGTLVEGGTLEATDIQLAPGGYIVGRVVPPPDLRRDLRWVGLVEPHQQDGTNAPAPASAAVAQGFTFRVGPLAAGTYRLSARLSSYDEARPEVAIQHWQGEVGDLRVEAGSELRDVAITLTESPR